MSELKRGAGSPDLEKAITGTKRFFPPSHRRAVASFSGPVAAEIVRNPAQRIDARKIFHGQTQIVMIIAAK